MNTSNLLTIRDLTIDFTTYDGTARVVDDLDLYVDRGEIVSLVGESGCGKTVTAKAVLGILPMPPGKIAEGEILFRGQDLLRTKDKDLQVLRGKEFGFVPQDPMTFLNPIFTIETQMFDMYTFRGSPDVDPLQYLRSFRDSRRRADTVQRALEMLRRVNIPDPDRVLRSYPVELSGGMRQRVLIAMALMSRPSFMIADEPATALDVSIGEQINEVLETRVREEGISVLYITHDLGVARRLSDRIYVMYAGHIVETASTQELFKGPKHPYTLGLLKSVPKIYGEISRGIEGVIPDYYNPPPGCRFHPRCPHAMPVCRRERPALREIRAGHRVACYLYSEEKKNE